MRRTHAATHVLGFILLGAAACGADPDDNRGADPPPQDETTSWPLATATVAAEANHDLWIAHGRTDALGHLRFYVEGAALAVEAFDGANGSPIADMPLTLLVDPRAGSGVIFAIDEAGRYYPRLVRAFPMQSDSGPTTRFQAVDWGSARLSIALLRVSAQDHSEQPAVIVGMPDSLDQELVDLLLEALPVVSPDALYSKSQVQAALAQDIAERVQTTVVWIGGGCAVGGALAGLLTLAAAPGSGGLSLAATLPAAKGGCALGAQVGATALAVLGDGAGIADVATASELLPGYLDGFRDDQLFTIAELAAVSLTSAAVAALSRFAVPVPGGKFKLILPVEPDDLLAGPEQLPLAGGEVASVSLGVRFNYFDRVVPAGNYGADRFSIGVAPLCARVDRETDDSGSWSYCATRVAAGTCALQIEYCAPGTDYSLSASVEVLEGRLVELADFSGTWLGTYTNTSGSCEDGSFDLVAIEQEQTTDGSYEFVSESGRRATYSFTGHREGETVYIRETGFTLYSPEVEWCLGDVYLAPAMEGDFSVLTGTWGSFSDNCDCQGVYLLQRP
jgi:hypothetical protein